jgi:hypothetical protein
MVCLTVAIANSDTGTFGMAYMSKSMIDETDMNKFKTISPPMYEDVREVPMDREIPIQVIPTIRRMIQESNNINLQLSYLVCRCPLGAHPD